MDANGREDGWKRELGSRTIEEETGQKVERAAAIRPSR
jgi:hypothetical protein